MPLNLYWKQRIIQLYLESVRSYGEVVRMLRDEGKIVLKGQRLYSVNVTSDKCKPPNDNRKPSNAKRSLGNRETRKG